MADPRTYTSISGDTINEDTGENITQSVKNSQSAQSVSDLHDALYDQQHPVTSISSDNGKATLDKKINTLNTLYSEKTDTSNPSGSNVNKGNPAPAPKAYFANSNGQEAEYTQNQLSDPSIQNFLKTNGYVMTKTEGPLMSFDQGNQLKSDLTSVDAKIKKLSDDWSSYNVGDDPAFKAIANDITNKYSTLISNMTISNTQRANALATLGIRTGSSQYAPGIQSGIEGEELRQGSQRISDLISQENTAISAARSALQTGKFAEFSNLMNNLEKIRSDKMEELKSYTSTLSDAIKKVQSTNVQATRDTLIARALSSGITDPKAMLQSLNFDASGKSTGYNFTADEINKTLKNLAPGGDITGLTGNIKDFFILKNNGSLPSSIKSLPEDQQLSGWLTYIKKPTPGGSGKKISMTEAQKNGWPLSVVGMDESEIVNSLSSSTSPDWFREKLEKQVGASLVPEYVQTQWDAFRAGKKTTQSKTTRDQNYSQNTDDISAL